MKYLKIKNKSNEDYDARRHTFNCVFIFFIPIKLITDWSGEGFMIREYYFMDKLLFKQKHKTKIWKPV